MRKTDFLSARPFAMATALALTGTACPRRGWRRVAGPGLLMLFASACSSSTPTGPTTFDSTPLVVVTSNQGAFTVEVHASTAGIVRGNNRVELIVKDAQSATPVDGLDLSLEPWMPTMGHGSSTTPQITPQGEGTYVASDVVLVMPGTWQLRTSLGSDLAIATVQIQ